MKRLKLNLLPTIQRQKSLQKRTFSQKVKVVVRFVHPFIERHLEIIEEKYQPNRFNIYPFHFSDGDNLTSDNARCVKFVEELMKVSNMFGYGEVNQYNRHSTLMSAYKNIKNENFQYYILKQKADVFHAMKSFFKKEETKLHA